MRDEVTGEWRKRYTEKRNDLYSSPTTLRVIKIENKMGGACSVYGEGRGVYMVLVGKRERDNWGDPVVDGKIILGGSSGSRMWGMDWIDLAQDRDRWRHL
jgi:hypothetical protein